jgi:hypothetical protein
MSALIASSHSGYSIVRGSFAADLLQIVAISVRDVTISWGEEQDRN